jgi:GNAT superfamily N-acetyltransferase
MQDIIIRNAVKEDCPRLLELVSELAIYEKAPDEVTVTLDHFIESGFGENPVWWAFVASVPDTENPEQRIIAGFALYYIRYSTWKGQTMYLEDILVTESLRGKGIGQKLFDRLLTEAKDLGFKRMTWQVLDWNEPAINFYKRQGARLDPEWLNATIDL